MGLDLNRGVTLRFHPTGIKIGTYDAAPGVYYLETGDLLEDARLAKEAGFDVERDLRTKLKNERLAKYKAELDAEMQSEEDALASAMSKRGNVDVRHIGGGQYAIFDKSGTRLTRVAMTKADVELLVGPVEADPNDPRSESPETPSDE